MPDAQPFTGWGLSNAGAEESPQPVCPRLLGSVKRRIDAVRNNVFARRPGQDHWAGTGALQKKKPANGSWPPSAPALSVSVCLTK